MKFASLSDAEDAFNKLQAGVETMLGVQAGITVILSALIAKHQSYDQLQLYMTTIAEVADSGAWKVLNEKSRAVALEYVEQVGQAPELRGQIRPLG